MSEAPPTRLDLTQMGIWGKQVKIQFAGHYEELWLQTIGDRTEALERGHEAMQRKLLDFRADSERAQALTEALLLAPASDLAHLVLEGERSQMESRLRRELPDPVNPRQDRTARESDEDFARRLAEHRRRCEELAAARDSQLEVLLQTRRQELLALPKEELVALARPRRIDIECWNAFARACDDSVLLRAVRRAEDHDQPYFTDISQVQALHPAVKDQLRRAYRELEPPEGGELPKSSTAILASVSMT